MNQHSKHISEFKPNQILQIINWGREKLNLSAKDMEADTTKIIIEGNEGGKQYAAAVELNGKIVKP